MRNAGLEEAQAGIKIASRNISNLICADDITLVAENKELKSLLMRVKKECVKAVYCHSAYLTICRVTMRNAGLDETQA